MATYARCQSSKYKIISLSPIDKNWYTGTFNSTLPSSPRLLYQNEVERGKNGSKGRQWKERNSLSLSPSPYPLRKCHQVSFVRKDFFLCMHSLLSSFFSPRAIEVKIKLSPVGFIELFCFISLVLKVYLLLERFSYDLEMKTREQTETKNEWK